MSLRGVVEADLRQTGRSWRLRGLGVGFGFFFAGAAAVFTALGRLPGGAADPGSYAAALVSPLGLLCPLVGVLVGYRAIVGGRASGRLRVLLSLPYGRSEVVLGTLLSRVALVSGTATLGALVGYLALVLFDGPGAVLAYGSVVGLALALQATFVAIGVGLSAASGSEPLVVAASLGSVVLFTMLWRVVVRTVVGGLAALGVTPATRAVTEFLFGLNPILAFSRLTALAVDTGSQRETVWGGWEFAGVVVCCWFVAPLLVGVWRFDGAELS